MSPMSMMCPTAPRRSLSKGRRLCPPDMTLAASPYWLRSLIASGMDLGAWYSKAAGIMVPTSSGSSTGEQVHDDGDGDDHHPESRRLEQAERGAAGGLGAD